MDFTLDRIRVICQKLSSMKTESLGELAMRYGKTGYKTSNVLPDPETLAPFARLTNIEGNDEHYWFYTAVAPAPKQEGKKLFLVFRTGQEGTWDAKGPQELLYLNGKMTQGMDVNHTEALLDFDTAYDAHIYFYTGIPTCKCTPVCTLQLVDERIEKLWYDLTVPYQALDRLDPDSEAYRTIMGHLKQAVGLLDLRVPFSTEFYTSVENSERYLQEEFYGKACGGLDAIVNCIGHTHIDVAWLWPVCQTVEKAQRSFATVVQFMREYPEYKFMSSQPQLYQFVKDEAPELYDEIKKLVREGRWEPEGAMWLEADNNLTSGESLVRQILFGKRFMKEEFGVDSKCVWLPDTFGYSAALPQIMKKCGVERFVTSKISWNESNTMPYDSFLWQGIDGSEVFTFFITARTGDFGRHTTYNGKIDPNHVLGAWKRYQQKEYNNEVVLLFGHGDGGGGPTREMLENERRLEKGLPGYPKTKIEFSGKFLDHAIEKFNKNTEKLGHTPRWVGELYLEFHRGTYTSIAKNKKNNRKSEQLMQSLEAASSMASLLTGNAYPQDEINGYWHTVLLNQFHDILPGSSILAVYEQTDKEYKALFENAGKTLGTTLAGIAGKVGTNGGLFVYNPNGFPVSDVVETENGKAFVRDIPALGYAVVKPEPVKNRVTVSEKMLENDFFRITFDDRYQIVSLYDKRVGREVVKSGEVFNELRLFEDFPKQFDAWEITNYYKDKMWKIDVLSSAVPVDEGARKGYRITREYLNSRIEQTIWLYDDAERIDVENVIDWHEEHVLLKAAFPVDVHANEATYEIQFGNVKRPTHENTSWDAAKFEVCAHKWADLSEDDYGVSILNDCKYGHSTEGNTLSLTLLKCATYPNPMADKEIHTFRYSIVPHAGSFKTAGIPHMAQAFNQPLVTIPVGKQTGELPERYSMISCDAPNIQLETVKKAEDSDALIVRFFENFDRRTGATLRLGFEAKKAFLCDMLENEISELPIDGRTVTVPTGNFEIQTVKLVL